MRYPPEVSRDFVLDKIDRFVEFQLWPIRTKLNPEGWLGNFQSGIEEKVAVHLLNSFIYFCETATDQIFLAGFNKLSQAVFAPDKPHSANKQEWRELVNQCVITYVTGETPSPTDSGHTFARKARQILHLPEDRIVSPAEALALVSTGRCRHLIFVDDFVGSGQQCIRTWERRYPDSQGNLRSFKNVHASGVKTKFFYCPTVCTTYGYGELQRLCPEVSVIPGHFVDESYSVFSANSIVWPQSLATDGPEVVRKISNKIGIPDNDGGEDDWRGFRKLGLAMAFSHSVPDATLPIFYWNRSGWTPLVDRA